MIIYLDDMLITAQLEQQLFQHLSITLWLFTALGFIVNLSVHDGTLQESRIPGFCDQHQHNVSVFANSKGFRSAEKDIRHVTEMLSVDQVPGSSCGQDGCNETSSFYCPVTLLGLQNLKIVVNTQLLGDDLPASGGHQGSDMVEHYLPPHCSSPIVKPEASIVITSDASTRGWGAACQKKRTGGGSGL